MIWIWQATEFQQRADLALLHALELGQGESADTPPTVSRSQVQRLIQSGKVTVNGLPVRGHQSFRPDDQIQIDFPEPPPSTLIPEPGNFTILFEDEHILVVNKPPRLTVHPSPTQMEHTLVHGLLHHTPHLSQTGGPLRPGIVHRIDQNTSGALVIAKTDVAHLRLTALFADHAIERTYWALCYGAPVESIKTIQSLIGRDTVNRKKMSMKVKIGKEAITRYRVLKRFGQSHQKPFASWLSVQLETGRTHQIRVHLSGLSHSVLGDSLYGKPTTQMPKWKALPEPVQKRVTALPGQALHARSLGFIHPITNEKLYFEAEPFAEFKELIDLLHSFQ